jgi:phenylpyruvate tautomerase PptA (4-oxalocrotonate tautomerase family)
MPFIHVDLETGLTDEEKIELTRRIVEVTHDAIGSAVGHINVVIRDLARRQHRGGGPVPGEAAGHVSGRA